MTTTVTTTSTFKSSKGSVVDLMEHVAAIEAVMHFIMPVEHASLRLVAKLVADGVLAEQDGLAPTCASPFLLTERLHLLLQDGQQCSVLEHLVGSELERFGLAQRCGGTRDQQDGRGIALLSGGKPSVCEPDKTTIRATNLHGPTGRASCLALEFRAAYRARSPSGPAHASERGAGASCA